MNEFKKGYQPRTNLVKECWSASKFPQCFEYTEAFLLSAIGCPWSEQW